MKKCSTVYLLFIYSLLHLVPLPKPLFCSSIDSITRNQKIVDGETMVSSRGVFELGFFSKNGSNNVRYVGMWLKEFPNEKILWVANREKPVTDTSGVLMIGDDGNLIISDGANNTIWSTNVTNSGSNQTSVATLSDGGNLVLRSNGQTLWESFNHPTDSLMPGMKFGLNNRTGEQILVYSWKNDTDPSPGNYVAMVDPQELPQVLVMNSTAKLWRTGQWTGRDFIGIPDVIKDNRVAIDLNHDYQQGTIYFTYDSSDKSIPVMYINDKGDVLLMQKDDKNQWSRLTIGPREQCDLYNTCGAFGTCVNTNAASPTCKCLKGYQPKSMDEWSRGNWKSGCSRISKLRCEMNTSSPTEDGFFRSPGMKLPDFAHSSVAEDLNECKSMCLKNCSCLACSYVVGIGCMLWQQDLIDIREFPAGGQELHIRLAYSELGHRKSKVKIIIVVIVISMILVLSSMWLIICRWRYRKRGKIIHKNGLTTSSEHKHIFNDGSSEVLSFTLQRIEAATDKFSERNRLGEGGFGPVYKGTLSDGRDIAVKRLSRSSGQGAEEFKNEVTLISKLQHKSLVKLLGFCIQGEERMLLYEYMPNKSLDKFIFGSGSTENELLDWNLRYKIIEGIARGILYLHHDSRLKIVHRDLKVSNILLDENMNPKISDFGMARIFQGDQSTANTNRVVGTYGYMSPEYALHGFFSEKSDVFSFGVMLLEIVSGKRNNGFYHPENPQNLLGYAWQFWTESNAFELLDPKLRNSSNVAQVKRCIHVALLCVQEQAKDRPTMSSVLYMLQNEKNLPSPEQPAFSLNGRVNATHSPSPRPFPDSVNDMSITTVDGR